MANFIVNVNDKKILFDDFFREFNADTSGWRFIGRISTGTVDSLTPLTTSYRNVVAQDGRTGIHNIYRTSGAIRQMGIFRQFDGIDYSNAVHKFSTEVYIAELGNVNSNAATFIGFLNDLTSALDNNITTYENSVYMEVGNQSNNWFFRFTSSLGNSFTTTTLTETDFPRDSWVNVTIEVDKILNEARLYINGTLLATHTTDLPLLGNVAIQHARVGGTSSSEGVYIDWIKLEKL